MPLAPYQQAKAMKNTPRLIPTSGKTLAQFRADHGISERGWKRLKAGNDIPRLTWITPGKPIIRPKHEEEWLDARTDPAPTASPFPTDDAA